MDSRKKNLIREIKKLKSIKADDGFKFVLRKKMFEEAGKSFVINMSGSRLHSQQASNLQKIFNNLLPRKQNMFLPLLLIAALLGGSAGATYASQSSLPGETLYPVKLATEKAQTILNVNDDAKEAHLHIKFSEERLDEVDKLAQKRKADPVLLKEVVKNYKKELSKARNILINTSAADHDQSARIARVLADATEHNKEILVKISGEVESDDALDALKDAWKEAVEHNDVATIELLKSLTGNTTTAAANTTTTTTTTTDAQINQTATNTTTTTTTPAITQDQQSQRMVANKIAEASHKISEAEKYIVKKEARGVDVAVAKTKIADAKILLTDAQNLLGQLKYTEAFLKAKDAHRAAQVAKESLEDKYKKEHDEEEDDDDDEKIFILPAALNGANNPTTTPTAANDSSVNTSTSTGAASVRSVTNHDEDDDDSHKDKKEKKHTEEKEEDRD